VITPATPDDAPALARILGDWVRETGWLPVLHSREEDMGFLSHLITTRTVHVLRLPEAAGFLARDGGMIEALYLAPQARGQGYGRALLDQAKAAEPSLTLWTFAANTAARAFYAREGFAVAEETDGAGNEAHLPDLRLIWTAKESMP
jgi:GNAT superfamily N-acetyltransferase